MGQFVLVCGNPAVWQLGLKIMNIVVNSKPQKVEPQTNLQQLLEILDIGKGRLAIEHNGEIVPRTLFRQTILQNDDSLEIVQAIGGG